MHTVASDRTAVAEHRGQVIGLIHCEDAMLVVLVVLHRKMLCQNLTFAVRGDEDDNSLALRIQPRSAKRDQFMTSKVSTTLFMSGP
jgi:hypothetical protein